MAKHDPSKADYPIMRFERQSDWAAWLDMQHAVSPGIWLQLAKTGSGIDSVTYAEALEVALCYGWIDGQKRSYDATSWLQKFTPRGARSIWSKINREKAEALIRNGQMRPAGLAAIARARQDGRWDAAYDSPSNAVVPDELQAALNNNPAASAFFATLNRQNRYAITFRIQTAKRAETRARRIQQFVEMLARHEKLYP